VLILCCGPDSYRALARARELEAAFRQKHDPEGRAIERLSSGKDGVEEVIEKGAGASLFSPRRFLRADGIISSCPKSKQKALIDTLSRDVESMIVVSVEEEKPTASTMKAFEGLPKLVVSEYPLLSSKAFFVWAQEVAKSLGNIDDKQVKALVDICEGDSWKFVNEAIKLAAGARLESGDSSSEESVYDMADHILKQDKERRNAIEEKDFGYSETSILMQQSLAAIRVRDREVGGLPPFVVRKLQSMKVPYPDEIFAASLEMLFLQRAGFCNEQESTNLIP
jgi:hypothetical protein